MNDHAIGVSADCRGNDQCVFDGRDMFIDIRITNRGRVEISIPVEYLKKRGPTIKLTDASTHREVYTRPNLADPELLSQVTSLPPGQSIHMEWVITQFELRQFGGEKVNVVADVTVQTTAQSEGRVIALKGSDVLHIVGN